MFFCVLICAYSLFAQTIRFEPDSAAVVDLWRIDPSTELFVGASFYYMNPEDSVIVWFDTSESDLTGELYVMVPGYADSAFYLFTNREPGARININQVLDMDIPVRTEIFFMYRLRVPDSLPRYTGPNRPGIDPEDQATYPGASFVSHEFGVRPGFGHRWSVAGRVCNEEDTPSDTIIFGFEDANTRLDPLNDSLIIADFDFNDVIFRVTGLYLNIDPYPDSIGLDVPETVQAGDTVKCTAKVWSDSMGVHIRGRKYDSLITWRILNPGVNRDTLFASEENDTTAFFIGKTAGAYRMVEARFINPLSGDTISAVRSIKVTPGPAALLYIELRADTASPAFNMNRPTPADRIQIASNQTNRSAYAILRDKFGNFAGFSSGAIWDTLTTEGMNSGIAGVAAGDVSLGEGIITKTGGSGDIMVMATYETASLTMSDTVLVNIVGAAYDSLRLLVRTSSGNELPVSSVEISTDRCTTFTAQGRRVDNGVWEGVDVQWDFSFPWNAFDLTEHGPSVNFCPEDTGSGNVTLVYSAFLRIMVPLRAVPGAPRRLVLYHNRKPLSPDTSLVAGRPFAVSAYILDKRGVRLSSFSLLSESTPLIWTFTESAVIADSLDSTGTVVNRKNFDIDYLPLKAHRTVLLTGAWEGFSDSCRLSITPGEPYRVVIESSADWSISPNHDAPIDTVEIPDTRTTADVFALLRDSVGNYVDSLRLGRWGCVDTVAATNAGIPAFRCTIVKNLSVREGVTKIFVVDTVRNFSDTACVRLLPYHFTALRIANEYDISMDSLFCTTNDDTTIVMQGLRSDTSLWRDVDGDWSISPSLTMTPTPPSGRSHYSFSPHREAKGWIAAALTSDTLFDTLIVDFKRGRPLWASVQLLTPANARIAGDTIRALVTIYNRHGPVEGVWCFTSDSSSGGAHYLDSIGDGGRAKKPEVIVGGASHALATQSNLGDAIAQCFTEGIDTVSFLLYYAPMDPDSQHRIRFIAGDLNAATSLFKLLPAPLASLRIMHNDTASGPDTLVLQAPLGSALIRAGGFDRFDNFLGEISSYWQVTGSLHEPDSAGPVSRIRYASEGIEVDESGTLHASAASDTSIKASLAVYIRSPLAQIMSAVTADVDGDGLLDRIDLKFSLPVSLRDSSAVVREMKVTYRGNTMAVERIETNGTTALRLILRETDFNAPQTGWTPTVAFDNPSLALDHGPQAFSVVCYDGAGPVIWSATKEMTGADSRTGDRVVIVFSEKVFGPGGQPLELNQPPDSLFDVWLRNDGTYEEVPVLDGIKNLYAVISDDTLVFIMKNGTDITNMHYISIHVADRAGTGAQSRIVDVAAANKPVR